MPAWVRQRQSALQHETHFADAWIESVGAGELRLPRFQRPWRWTDAQILDFFASLLRGYHVGSLILWERYGLPPSVERFGEVTVASPGGRAYLVVDGQQRLGALVTAACSGRFWLDLDTGALVTAPGRWKVPAGDILIRERVGDHFDWYGRHAVEHGLPPLDVLDAWRGIYKLCTHVEIGAVRFAADWTLETVVESYARLNTRGTPMDPDDLADGLRRAQG